jgi:hypothetical protein
MSIKRGNILFLGIVLVILSMSLILIENDFLTKLTGWVSSFGSVGIEIIPKNIYAPENLSIFVNDSGVVLNWSQTPSGSGYKIWYSDNVTEILRINHSDTNYFIDYPANVTLIGITNTTWIDPTAGSVEQRYYAVASYMGDRSTVAEDKVGKYNLTIYGGDNIGINLMGTPLEDNISTGRVSPPNDFSWIYGIDYTLNETWLYAYSSSGAWSGFSTLTEMEAGRGFILDSFNNLVLITSAGRIPTGNITRTIYGENNVGHTTIGWDSISTNGNISELISPPNDFSWIYAVDYTQNDTWLYAYSSSGAWSGFSTLTEMEAGGGYLFDSFNTPVDINYERNPY